MNQRNIIAVLGITVVILLGTTIYFATISIFQHSKPAAKQPTAPLSKTQTPRCGKLSQFKNESWANNFAARGTVFNDENEGCKIGDIFLANNGPSEFGCNSVVKYDIKNNKLIQTSLAAPNACATHFGEITDNYVEYFGQQGDAGMLKNYHGRYYFKEDRIESIK
ncbi:MAG: hypothetical protein V3574_00605 [Candidatus Moraniibacteriota bacterium]